MLSKLFENTFDVNNMESRLMDVSSMVHPEYMVLSPTTEPVSDVEEPDVNKLVPIKQFVFDKDCSPMVCNK